MTVQQPAVQRPTVDVVVVLYHCDPDLLRRCAASVVHAARYSATSVQLVLVVNGGDVPDVLPSGLEVVVVRSPGNIGYGGAANTGVRAATGRHVLLLNADAELHETALEAFLAASTARPGALLGGWMTRDGEVEIDSSIDWDFSVERILERCRHRRRRSTDEPDGPVAVEKVSGGALFAERSVLAALGPFDERFFMYCEDADLSRRAKQAGHDVLAVPGARVLHVGSASEASFHALVESARADGAIRVTAYHRGLLTSLLQRAELTVVTLLGLALVRDPAARRARAARLRSLRHWGLRRDVPRFLGD